MYFINLLFVILLMFIVATSNDKRVIITNNINTVKAVQTFKLKDFEDDKIQSLEFVSSNDFLKVFSLSELNLNKNKKVEFEGTLTGYGPDCVGCSGKVGCAPYQNVKNGNIYYEDKSYGKIRILAADPSIPCGSIIKVSNFKHVDGDIYGIVLDRGSAIHGLTMDLLYESEAATKSLGRSYNINFKIERWGF